MSESKPLRLSDRILDSLELALHQEDIQIAELLTNALELSMTRNTGGGEFIERRDYSEDLVSAIGRLKELRDKASS